MCDVFRVRYRNTEASNWIDYIPVELIKNSTGGPFRYQCQLNSQWRFAEGTLILGEGHFDVTTSNEEAARFEIYEGTFRAILQRTNNSIEITDTLWADPGDAFEKLTPAPIIDRISKSEIDTNREIDRLEYLAKHRSDQARFRRELMSLYHEACAVTGCRIPELLEVAHLKTTADKDINHVKNGIVLRSDIHQLFDAGLLELSKDGLTFEASKWLTDKYYLGFDGAPVFRPNPFSPSPENINAHRRATGFTGLRRK